MAENTFMLCTQLLKAGQLYCVKSNLTQTYLKWLLFIVHVALNVIKDFRVHA